MGLLVKDIVKNVIAEQQAKVDDAVEKARERIENAMEQNGQYTHNIISFTLRDLATKFGYKYADELVNELNLDDLYEIGEYSETQTND